MVVLFSSMLYFYSIEIPKHIRYVTITFVKNDTEIKVLRDWEFKSRSYLSSDYQIILDGDIIIMKNIKMNTSDSYKLNNDREAKKVYQYLKYSRFQ